MSPCVNSLWSLQKGIWSTLPSYRCSRWNVTAALGGVSWPAFHTQPRSWILKCPAVPLWEAFHPSPASSGRSSSTVVGQMRNTPLSSLGVWNSGDLHRISIRVPPVTPTAWVLWHLKSPEGVKICKDSNLGLLPRIVVVQRCLGLLENRQANATACHAQTMLPCNGLHGFFSQLHVCGLK